MSLDVDTFTSLSANICSFFEEGTNYCSSQNCIAADYQGQIPWTYSGQRIDMEGTSTKCDE